MEILLCNPEFYKISYEINPWMKVENKVAQERAVKQWKSLEKTITKAGASLKYIDPIDHLPDMVFTANGAVVLNNIALIAKFRHEERQGEETYWRDWFTDRGYKVIEPRFLFEGAGDALWSGKTMFVGYGFRTDALAAHEIYEQMTQEVILIKLNDPYFYHLDTCFCPLNEDEALVYRGAIDPLSYRLLGRHIDLIEVDEDEAKLFACNSVVIDKTVVMPKGCNKTKKQLKKRGYNVKQVEMNEFIKAGGACKCLTLRIDSNLS
jgi:N-dimethylarginine dimethylaminohydrolase